MSSINHDHALYDKDFYGWAMETAKFIRNKEFEKIDIEHLAEEVESMGRSEQRSIYSYLEKLFFHLLKWQYQPQAQCNSWKSTIKNCRKGIKILLEESPSLFNSISPEVEENDVEKNKNKIKKWNKTYESAVESAAEETMLPKETFPIVCPFTLPECLDENFWPE